MVRVSLEVAIGFVVKLAVCHQFLHAGEGLRAAHGGTAEEFAFQGLCGWAVGTQMLCQVANAGETEAAARAGAGYLLSCRMHTARSPVPSPPTLSRALPQKGMYEAGITLWFPIGTFTLSPPPD